MGTLVPGTQVWLTHQYIFPLRGLQSFKQQLCLTWLSQWFARRLEREGAQDVLQTWPHPRKEPDGFVFLGLWQCFFQAWPWQPFLDFLSTLAYLPSLWESGVLFSLLFFSLLSSYIVEFKKSSAEVCLHLELKSETCWEEGLSQCVMTQIG